MEEVTQSTNTSSLEGGWCRGLVRMLVKADIRGLVWRAWEGVTQGLVHRVEKGKSC